MSYLCYLCLFAHSGVQHILCCVFVLFFFVLSMLPVSLDCPFLIAPSVFSNVYLTIKTSASPEACIILLNILIRIIFDLAC
jgi:hypothetical protein